MAITGYDKKKLKLFFLKHWIRIKIYFSELPSTLFWNCLKDTLYFISLFTSSWQTSDIEIYAKKSRINQANYPIFKEANCKEKTSVQRKKLLIILTKHFNFNNILAFVYTKKTSLLELCIRTPMYISTKLINKTKFLLWLFGWPRPQVRIYSEITACYLPMKKNSII